MSSGEQIKTGTKLDLFVEGMHCAACEMLIERRLKKVPYLKNVNAKLSKGRVYFQVTKPVTKEELLKQANDLVNRDGYRIAAAPFASKVNYQQLALGFVIASIIMALFFAMQKLGIAGILGGDTLSWPMIFLIGIVASLSTCMAVVGGLVLSISSTYARSGSRNKPLLAFHLARLTGFLILGGLIGLIGSVFAISPEVYLALSLLLFLVMLILGINLLDVFPFFRRFQLRMPKALSGGMLDNSGVRNRLMPLLLGVGTFFLPCGFTQSMQLNAIASGSFVNGALIMLVFALGTLPVLSLISFSSYKLSASQNSGLFFKTAGFLVLFFAVFNFLSALAGAGIIDPLF